MVFKSVFTLYLCSIRALGTLNWLFNKLLIITTVCVSYLCICTLMTNAATAAANTVIAVGCCSHSFRYNMCYLCKSE